MSKLTYIVIAGCIWGIATSILFVYISKSFFHQGDSVRLIPMVAIFMCVGLMFGAYLWHIKSTKK